MKITKRQLRQIIKEEMNTTLKEENNVVTLNKEPLQRIMGELHAAKAALGSNPEANELVTSALNTLQNEMAKSDGNYRSSGDPSVGGQEGH